METSKRIKSEDGEESSSKISLSAFHIQDLTIKIGNENLYVNRDQLMAESPVFRTMLTGNFKEKNAREIELHDKDPTTFALFLQHTLPGFDGLILSESTARRILPLSHEYQTDISKIDKVLATCTGQNEYKSVDKLIDHILEAELYTLSKYLTASIQKASEFSPTSFERNRIFHRISSDTKANIFTMRCKAMESDISNCMDGLQRCVPRRFQCTNQDCHAKQKVREAITVISSSKYINSS
ncbi:BTB and MATH domain-containing protein 38-like [Mytilus trossulus]|uniref:BTB and MATH domain-containing protein 38-like n=1 Tax=Mytilus trossulus TaxID=6551 RepID=UPI003006D403